MDTNLSLTDGTDHGSIGFAHLFTQVDGQPIVFSMKICRKKQELDLVIQQHGGILVAMSGGPNTIHLSGDDISVSSVFPCFKHQFILDCVEQEELLQLADYRLDHGAPYCPKDLQRVMLGHKQWAEILPLHSLPNEGAEACPPSPLSSFSSDDDLDEWRAKQVFKKQRFRVRREYTNDERVALVTYILDNGMLNDVGGRAIWQEIASKQVLGPGRTWQSIKEHFRRQVVPFYLSQLGLSLHQMRMCLAKFPEVISNYPELPWPSKKFQVDSRPSGPLEDDSQQKLEMHLPGTRSIQSGTAGTSRTDIGTKGSCNYSTTCNDMVTPSRNYGTRCEHVSADRHPTPDCRGASSSSQHPSEFCDSVPTSIAGLASSDSFDQPADWGDDSEEETQELSESLVSKHCTIGPSASTDDRSISKIPSHLLANPEEHREENTQDGRRRGSATEADRKDSTEEGHHRGCAILADRNDCTEKGRHRGSATVADREDSTEAGRQRGNATVADCNDSTEAGRHRGNTTVADRNDSTEAGRHRGNATVADRNDSTEAGRHRGSATVADRKDSTEAGRHRGSATVADREDSTEKGRHRGHANVADRKDSTKAGRNRRDTEEEHKEKSLEVHSIKQLVVACCSGTSSCEVASQDSVMMSSSSDTRLSERDSNNGNVFPIKRNEFVRRRDDFTSTRNVDSSALDGVTPRDRGGSLAAPNIPEEETSVTSSQEMAAPLQTPSDQGSQNHVSGSEEVSSSQDSVVSGPVKVPAARENVSSSQQDVVSSKHGSAHDSAVQGTKNTSEDYVPDRQACFTAPQSRYIVDSMAKPPQRYLHGYNTPCKQHARSAGVNDQITTRPADNAFDKRHELLEDDFNEEQEPFEGFKETHPHHPQHHSVQLRTFSPRCLPSVEPPRQKSSCWWSNTPMEESQAGGDAYRPERSGVAGQEDRDCLKDVSIVLESESISLFLSEMSLDSLAAEPVLDLSNLPVFEGDEEHLEINTGTSSQESVVFSSYKKYKSRCTIPQVNGEEETCRNGRVGGRTMSMLTSLEDNVAKEGQRNESSSQTCSVSQLKQTSESCRNVPRSDESNTWVREEDSPSSASKSGEYPSTPLSSQEAASDARSGAVALPSSAASSVVLTSWRKIREQAVTREKVHSNELGKSWGCDGTDGPRMKQSTRVFVTQTESPVPLNSFRPDVEGKPRNEQVFVPGISSICHCKTTLSSSATSVASGSTVTLSYGLPVDSSTNQTDGARPKSTALSRPPRTSIIPDVSDGEVEQEPLIVRAIKRRKLDQSSDADVSIQEPTNTASPLELPTFEPTESFVTRINEGTLSDIMRPTSSTVKGSRFMLKGARIALVPLNTDVLQAFSSAPQPQSDDGGDTGRNFAASGDLGDNEQFDVPKKNEEEGLRLTYRSKGPPLGRRRIYTTEQRLAMVTYILENDLADQTTGTAMWQQMARQKVIKGGFTWQSIKDHFRRQVLPHHLLELGLTEQQMKTLLFRYPQFLKNYNLGDISTVDDASTVDESEPSPPAPPFDPRRASCSSNRPGNGPTTSNSSFRPDKPPPTARGGSPSHGGESSCPSSTGITASRVITHNFDDPMEQEEEDEPEPRVLCTTRPKLQRSAATSSNKNVLQDSDDSLSLDGEEGEKGRPKRQTYSRDEDMLILRFLLDTKRWREVGGCVVWSAMQSSVSGLGHRSWHSLKERYRRVLLKRLGRYPLTALERSWLRGSCEFCERR